MTYFGRQGGHLSLARPKLVASCEIDSTYDTLSRLAVLDVQLSLDFGPRGEIKKQIKEASLVESCIRIAYSIPDHQEYLRSGYTPSC